MDAFENRLEALRRDVAEAGRVPTDGVLEAAQAFMAFCAKPEWAGRLAAFAPDYTLDEYLVAVDADGKPAHLEAGPVSTPHDPGGRPLFSRVSGEGVQGVCVARWLAHLAGFRHCALHLFLDHPTRKDYTLLQLRSFSKCGYPGCFDIPVGGHIKETTPVETALAEELEEELGLSLCDDTAGVEQIAVYEHVDPPGRPAFRDVEARLVFAGRLREEAFARAHFTDAEAAALCIFRIGEVAELAGRQPERVASGLRGSFEHYLAWKG